MRKIVNHFALLLLMVVVACKPTNPNFQKEAANSDFLHDSMKELTDIIVHDIFSPPVASRIYAYPSIAAYETLRHAHPEYKSLVGQLKDLKSLPSPEEDKEYCYPVASVQALLTVGRTMIFSEDKIKEFHRALMSEIEAINIPDDVLERSIDFGNKMAAGVLAWADKDNYKETRTFPKFSINDDPARWQPTPPMYMDGIEPHWMKIRPFVIDSATQFIPEPPTAFSLEEDSQFYKELMEVYTALDEDTENRMEIAEFWDCNPYVSQQIGHVMVATKKITPGGHWIGITNIACKKAGANMMETVEAYAIVSIALADGFISCWDEKYRSMLIRPETVINTYIDESWTPALQTPPFPEHTSGHSVISRAAAVALTHLFGDDFSFEDTSEEEYGLPMRAFDSFLQASEEAAISRLYGGIHYRPAIDYGVAQGEEVGKWVIDHITTRPDRIGMKTK